MLTRYALMLFTLLVAESEGHARFNKAPAPYVVDGDSIIVDTQEIRLWGIDAPELLQTCRNHQQAGKIARAFLIHLIDNQPITCRFKARDHYGRQIMQCRNHQGNDLGQLMVEAGWAWAFEQYTMDYAEHEYRAKRMQLGVHGMACQEAWHWRQLNRHRNQR